MFEHDHFVQTVKKWFKSWIFWILTLVTMGSTFALIIDWYFFVILVLLFKKPTKQSSVVNSSAVNRSMVKTSVSCPNCGAPITGYKNMTYKCEYCYMDIKL
ncbi:MAG: hypothetical protein LBT37_05835 [Lactobacillaceae bacterium]|nr:hypothetical protein [Lactobacillaceae bacterium]